MNNPWVIKIVAAAGVVALIVVLLFIVKKQNDIITRQNDIYTKVIEQKTLLDGQVRSSSTYATKDDLVKFAKENNVNLTELQKDVKSILKSPVLAGINSVTIISDGGSSGNGSNLPSTTVVVRPPEAGTPDPKNLDPWGYQLKEQKYSLTETFGDGTKVPFGSVGFSAWSQKPWTQELAPRKYNLTNTVFQDENGRIVVYNKFSLNVGGKDYNISFPDATFIQQYPSSKFSWNPSLFLTANVGAYLNTPSFALTPSLNLFMFSYGMTKTSPDWTLLGLGAGYDTKNNRPLVLITPAQYNVAKNIPLIDNLHVGLSFGTDLKNNYTLMTSVGVKM